MEYFYYLHTELDHEFLNVNSTDAVSAGNGRPLRRQTTCLSIYGKDVSSETILVRIRGFRIKFYISFRDVALAKHCCVSLLRHDENNIVVALKSETDRRTSLMMDENHRPVGADVAGDYETNTRLENVVRVQVRTRKDVGVVMEKMDSIAREYFADRGESSGSYEGAVKYYESNLDAITVATRHLGLDACRWCTLDTRRCTVGETNRQAFVGREYVFFESGANDPTHLFSSAAAERTEPQEVCLQKGLLPPPCVKVFSFDIECMSRDRDTMPDASTDSVIQISSVISADALGRDGATSTFDRHLFTLGGSCDPVENVEIHVHTDERQMLAHFVRHMHDEDPDIVTGYNISAFDLPYLFKRMELLNVTANAGRGGRQATCRKSNHEAPTKRYASYTPKSHLTRIPGRIVFDMYTHVRREVVLRSYTLNNVAAHFLDKRKDDVAYNEIPALFHGDATGRARLGRYCVTDAQLVLELAFKRQTFLHAFQQCKVFRTMLQYLVDRGQQIRFYSLLLAWCVDRGVLIDDLTSRRAAPRTKRPRSEDERVAQAVSNDQDKKHERSVEKQTATTTTTTRRRVGYAGATVLEPVVGLYRTPVICLDFASLYPSIMIGYNLCFTTFVRNEEHGKVLAERGLATRSPVGSYFLDRSTKTGVLPSILEMLLDQRCEVRESMKGLRDSSLEYQLLDGQQAALKVAANSIYGAIGCETNVLHLVEIPSSVTAYGRRLIERTKRHVETNFEGMRVIYGDTDSCLVNAYDWNSSEQRVRECVEIGRRMAEDVTVAIDRSPIRLQFETVYQPFLLCSKKRYAARIGGDNTPQSVKYKGLQVVRRDNCTFATKLMRYVLDSLLDTGGVTIERVMDELRARLKSLFDREVDPDELVISKEWKKKGASGQPHDRLARRMQMRDPNSAPSIGDRVPYVIVTTPSGAKLCDRAEDPTYARVKGLQIDFLYYAEKQVAKPVADLLRVALASNGPAPSLEEIKDGFWPQNGPRRDGDRRKRPGERTWTRKASVGSRRVTDYFQPSARRPD